MLKYRSQQPSGTLSAAPRALVQHAPAMLLKPPKLRKSPRYKVLSHYQLVVDELFRNVDVSPCQETVQEEFDRYMAALLSPHDTDILQFWGVGYTHINKDKQC